MSSFLQCEGRHLCCRAATAKMCFSIRLTMKDTSLVPFFWIWNPGYFPSCMILSNVLQFFLTHGWSQSRIFVSTHRFLRVHQGRIQRSAMTELIRVAFTPAKITRHIPRLNMAHSFKIRSRIPLSPEGRTAPRAAFSCGAI